MFERSKLPKLQLTTQADPQYFDYSSKDQSFCSSTIQVTGRLSSHLVGSMYTSDVSNESCSSTTTTDSSCQTPGYLLENTPRKQTLSVEILSGKNK